MYSRPCFEVILPLITSDLMWEKRLCYVRYNRRGATEPIQKLGGDTKVVRKWSIYLKMKYVLLLPVLPLVWKIIRKRSLVVTCTYGDVHTQFSLRHQDWWTHRKIIYLKFKFFLKKTLHIMWLVCGFDRRISSGAEYASWSSNLHHFVSYEVIYSMVLNDYFFPS